MSYTNTMFHLEMFHLEGYNLFESFITEDEAVKWFQINLPEEVNLLFGAKDDNAKLSVLHPADFC